MGELLHDGQQQDPPLKRRQRAQALLEAIAEIDVLERRALADGRRHDAPYGVERSEQLDLEITVGEMVWLGDHHLEADAHVFVAHLLRAGQEASVAA